MRRAIALIGAMAASILGLSAAPASAATHCECGVFVAKYENLTGGLPQYACQMGTMLKNNGFRYVGKGIDPNPGDVAIWACNNPSPTGHIAVVQAITWDSPGYIVTFRGANQGGTQFTQSSCSDVSIIRLDYSTASYYRR